MEEVEEKIKRFKTQIVPELARIELEERVIEIYKDLLIKSALVEKLEEYIDLLGEELDSAACIASLHHWKSYRVEQGEELRQQIEELKNAY